MKCETCGQPILSKTQKETIREVAASLGQAFDWETSREGYDYWLTLYNRLIRLSEGGAL